MNTSRKQAEYNVCHGIQRTGNVIYA